MCTFFIIEQILSYSRQEQIWQCWVLSSIDAYSIHKIATDMVANATNIFSLATKNSGLDATLATKFLYDLELNQISKVKQTFHPILLCFHHKFAKLHKQSQVTSKFIPGSVRNIFKQSNLMGCVIPQGF